MQAAANMLKKKPFWQDFLLAPKVCNIFGCVCDCVRVFVLVGNAFKINKNPQREQLSEKRSNRQGQEAWSAMERGEGEKGATERGAMNEELEQALR